jgi:GTP-binding protein
MQIHEATFIKGIRGTDKLLYDKTPQVAFIGRSNVGKSSIINALVHQKDLVKTGKKPGKTTEINFFKINRGKAYFVDLPGYGYARIEPELKEKIRKLILWYLQFSNVKPLCVVLILDVKAGLTDFDSQMIEALAEAEHRFIVVANKVDKLNKKELRDQMEVISKDAQTQVIACSAATKEGIDTLLQTIFSK